MTAQKTAHLAIHGAKWVTIGIVIQKVYQFAAFLLLARLLAPEDFGLVAIGVLVLEVVARVKLIGLHSALVQRRDNVEQAADAFFHIHLFLTILAYALIFQAAPWLARFFQNPSATAIVRVLSIQLFIGALAAAHRALAIRDLRFKTQVAASMGASLTNGAVSVLLATLDFGVWALVCGSLAGTAVEALTWRTVCPRQLSGRMNWRIAGQLFRFGASLSAASAMEYVLDTGVRVIIGKLLSVTALGVYDVTWRLIHVPFRNVVAVAQRVALPAFCREQHDGAWLQRWYLKIVMYSSVIMAPVALFFLFAGDFIVLAALGPKWSAAGSPLRALALFTFLLPFLSGWPVYVATQRSHYLLLYSVVRLAVTLPLVAAASLHSLTSACLMLSVSSAMLAPLNLHLLSRILGLTCREMFGAVAAPARAALLLALFLAAARIAVTMVWPDGSAMFKLCAVAPCGLVYAWTIHRTHPNLFSEAWSIALASMGSQSLDEAAGERPAVASPHGQSRVLGEPGQGKEQEAGT